MPSHLDLQAAAREQLGMLGNGGDSLVTTIAAGQTYVSCALALVQCHGTRKRYYPHPLPPLTTSSAVGGLRKLPAGVTLQMVANLASKWKDTLPAVIQLLHVAPRGKSRTSAASRGAPAPQAKGGATKLRKALLPLLEASNGLGALLDDAVDEQGTDGTDGTDGSMGVNLAIAVSVMLPLFAMQAVSKSRNSAVTRCSLLCAQADMRQRLQAVDICAAPMRMFATLSEMTVVTDGLDPVSGGGWAGDWLGHVASKVQGELKEVWDHWATFPSWAHDRAWSGLQELRGDAPKGPTTDTSAVGVSGPSNGTSAAGVDGPSNATAWMNWSFGADDVGEPTNDTSIVSVGGPSNGTSAAGVDGPSNATAWMNWSFGADDDDDGEPTNDTSIVSVGGPSNAVAWMNRTLGANDEAPTNDTAADRQSDTLVASPPSPTISAAAWFDGSNSKGSVPKIESGTSRKSLLLAVMLLLALCYKCLQVILRKTNVAPQTQERILKAYRQVVTIMITAPVAVSQLMSLATSLHESGLEVAPLVMLRRYRAAAGTMSKGAMDYISSSIGKGVQGIWSWMSTTTVFRSITPLLTSSLAPLNTTWIGVMLVLALVACVATAASSKTSDGDDGDDGDDAEECERIANQLLSPSC